MSTQARILKFNVFPDPQITRSRACLVGGLSLNKLPHDLQQSHLQAPGIQHSAQRLQSHAQGPFRQLSVVFTLFLNGGRF